MLHRTGAWIFVSHSLGDILQVRRVRNSLEELGHYPLLFYLRSLADDSEIDGLIRREIEARNFFLLCDSENARASRWVQAEVRIIKSQFRKVFATLNLDAPWEEQFAVIQAVSVRISAYVSAAAIDRLDADAMTTALERADYGVVTRDILSTLDADLEMRIRREIDDAMSTGLFLVLLSPERLAQPEGFHWLELNHALERSLNFSPDRTTIIPIVLRDFQRTMALLPSRLHHINALDLSNVPTTLGKADALVRALDQIAPKIDA